MQLLVFPNAWATAAANDHHVEAYTTDTSPHKRAFLYISTPFLIQSLIGAQGASDAI